MRFARERLGRGECVKANLASKTGACPTLAAGQIGDSECTRLVQAAVRAAGAREPNFAVRPYDCGAIVAIDQIQSGDILQLEQTCFRARMAKQMGNYRPALGYHRREVGLCQRDY